MASNSPENVKKLQQKLFVPGTLKRKQFGLLERPSFSPSVPQVSFKIFVNGQSGSGKSHLIRKLCGLNLNNRYVDTIGIEMHYVYWPMRIENRLMLFRLELWDTSAVNFKKYTHIKESCLECVDAVLICFSVTSRSQWLELPIAMSKFKTDTDQAAVMAVATRLDLLGETAVSDADMRSFEVTNGFPVLRSPAEISSTDELSSISPMLNFICRTLWQRDQDLLTVSKEKR